MHHRGKHLDPVLLVELAFPVGRVTGEGRRQKRAGGEHAVLVLQHKQVGWVSQGRYRWGMGSNERLRRQALDAVHELQLGCRRQVKLGVFEGHREAFSLFRARMSKFEQQEYSLQGD